jgi:serine incorporator 1/3
LCNACLGGTGEGTTGRKRAVLLLTIAITFALWFQYNVGPGIVQETGWVWKTYRAIPGTGKLVYKAWKNGCDQYQGDLLSQCAGNAGVYRPMFLATLFFIFSAMATHLQPHLNREAWPAKYAVFLFALLFTMFIPNSPLFTGFFLWTSRIGATVFVVLQQVILIDVAYNWNDDWVEKSNEADRISYGSGGSWLKAIVGMCVLMYSASIAGIGLLYHFFDGCPENTWVITLTLLGIVAMTALQLAGQDGSLLTSSVMSVYAVYLCFSIVSKNPNGSCNPRLGHNDVSGIVIGLTLTAISLAWTGWAWSAEQRLTVDAYVSK